MAATNKTLGKSIKRLSHSIKDPSLIGENKSSNCSKGLFYTHTQIYIHTHTQTCVYIIYTIYHICVIHIS